MKLLTLLLAVLLGVAVHDSAATNVTLYETSFEAPAFQTGLPIRGQDGWEMFHDGEAISVSTTNARTGTQCLRMDGSLLEPVGPKLSDAYCYSAIFRDNPPATPPAIVEITAYTRLDGPMTGTNGAAADDLMSANLLAIGDAGGQGVRLGGFLVSSAGKIFTVGSRSEDAYKYSAPMTFGAYHKLVLRVDFIARNLRYFVNGTYLGVVNFAPGITADRLAGGYLEMAGPTEPLTTPYVYNPSDYTAFFDDYSLVSIPLSPVNAVIEFASTNFFSDEFELTAKVNVVRRGFLSAAVRVKVSTTNDTAKADEDYEETATFVTFAAGETNKAVEIPIFDDYLAEPDKAFLVRISELPPGATSGKPEARVLIRDDERPGSIDYSWSSNYGLSPLGSNEVKYAVPQVYPLPVQPDGRLIVAFDIERPTSGVESFDVVRLNVDGSLDSSFPPIQSSRYLTAYLMLDGKIIIGEDNYPHGYRVFRRNPDGTPDSTLTASITNSSIGFKGLSNGMMFAYGDSIGVNGQPPRNLLRLNSDGSVDPSFVAPATPPIYGGVFPLPNGKVLLAASSGPSTGGGLQQLNSNGTVDASFNVGTGIQGGGIMYPGISSVILQEDGKLVVGGNFRNFNGQVRNSIVRLNTNGSIDTTFATGAGFTFRDYTGVRVPGFVTVHPLPGKNILVSDSFDQFDGKPVTGPIILHPDGSRDPSFEGTYLSDATYVDGVTYALAVVNGRVIYFRDYGLGRLRMDLPLRILSSAKDIDGTTQLTANALTGRSYTLQSSETLTHWTDRATQSATTNRIDFNDGPVGLPAQRFYRLKQN